MRVKLGWQTVPPNKTVRKKIPEKKVTKKIRKERGHERLEVGFALVHGLEVRVGVTVRVRCRKLGLGVGY